MSTSSNFGGRIIRAARVASSYADWKLRVGQKLDQTQSNYKKFIILGEGRTGTNLLVSALQSQKNVVCYGELFHQHAPIWRYSHINDSPRSISARLAKNNPQSFLDRFVWCGYSDRIQAVGCKLIYWHVHPSINKSLFEVISRVPDLHVIHVWRRDLLRWYVSEQLAQKTGQWIREPGQHSAAVPRILIEPEKLIERIKVHVGFRAEHLELFQKNNSVVVTYEDFSADLRRAVKSLAEFLSIRETNPPKVNISKQGNYDLADVIENYDELLEFLQKNSYWISLGQG